MRFDLEPLRQEHALAIAGWRYAEPYAFYDPGAHPEGRAELLDPVRRGSRYFAALQRGGGLAGYFEFTLRGESLEIGLGLRPDLTGRGLGRGFALHGLAYGRRAFEPRAFELAVAAWNGRAIRTYTRLGFEAAGTERRRLHGAAVPFLWMARAARARPARAGARLRIVPYDPSWPLRFAAERRRILAAAGRSLRVIEHIGSTAVPGLGAKPILDLMGGVEHLDDAAALIEPLERLGYEYVPAFEAEMPDRRYFRKGSDGARSHHLHVVERGGAFWRRHLRFRDLLRADAEAARGYYALKLRLARRFGADRQGYTDAKAGFIEAVVARARRG